MERKILYVASTFSHIRNFHLPYLQAFRDMGWTVHVACGGPVAPLPQAHQVIELPFDKSISFLKNREAISRLRQLFHCEHYDLVSTHTSLASFFVRLTVPRTGPRPLVACMVHGYLFDEETPLKRRLPLALAEKMTAPVTDLLMTMNHWDEAYAQTHRLGRQIFNVPGVGVQFEALGRVSPEEVLDLRRTHHIGNDQFLFVYAAEFSKRKNQGDLLRAMAQLPEQVCLVLPGDGALRQSCMELAQQLGLGPRAIFPGQSDMAPWYAAANAAVSVSRSEGLPFNIMEAMNCRLPVAASAVKGHVDLIEHGKTGLLFPWGDVDACAACMRQLYEDRALCHRLGEDAHTAIQSYRLDCVLPQVMQCYEALLPVDLRTPAEYT